MNISLTPEQEQFIQEKINSGKYETADELISEAFRLLEERDKHYEKWVEETRKKVAIGIEQAEKGQVTDGRVVIAKLREKIHQKRESKA